MNNTCEIIDIVPLSYPLFQIHFPTDSLAISFKYYFFIHYLFFFQQLHIFQHFFIQYLFIIIEKKKLKNEQ